MRPETVLIARDAFFISLGSLLTLRRGLLKLDQGFLMLLRGL